MRKTAKIFNISKLIVDFKSTKSKQSATLLINSIMEEDVPSLVKNENKIIPMILRNVEMKDANKLWDLVKHTRNYSHAVEWISALDDARCISLFHLIKKEASRDVLISFIMKLYRNQEIIDEILKISSDSRIINSILSAWIKTRNPASVLKSLQNLCGKYPSSVDYNAWYNVLVFLISTSNGNQSLISRQFWEKIPNHLKDVKMYNVMLTHLCRMDVSESIQSLIIEMNDSQINANHIFWTTCLNYYIDHDFIQEATQVIASLLSQIDSLDPVLSTTILKFFCYHSTLEVALEFFSKTTPVDITPYNLLLSTSLKQENSIYLEVIELMLSSKFPLDERSLQSFLKILGKDTLPSDIRSRLDSILSNSITNRSTFSIHFITSLLSYSLDISNDTLFMSGISLIIEKNHRIDPHIKSLIGAFSTTDPQYLEVLSKIKTF